MEGRDSPPKDDPIDDDIPPHLPNTHEPPPPPPPQHINVHSETYVIQIPKEIIYRIPPPENAAIVEQFRKPVNKDRSHCKRVVWIIVALAVIAVATGATIAVLRHIFSPRVPSFSIDKVALKTLKSSSHQRNSQFRFEITVKANNRNKRMDVSYHDGNVLLLHKQHNIATGKFPELNQDGGGSDEVHLRLKGLSATLPKEIEKGNDHHQHHPVPLKLKMQVRVKFDGAILNMGNKDVDVVCTFKLMGLGSKVQSQQCDSEFK